MKYGLQSRTIFVEHPYMKTQDGKPVIVFEANVIIKNLNRSLVKKIKNINIEYDLVEKN